MLDELLSSVVAGESVERSTKQQPYPRKRATSVPFAEDWGERILLFLLTALLGTSVAVAVTALLGWLRPLPVALVAIVTIASLLRIVKDGHIPTPRWAAASLAVYALAVVVISTNVWFSSESMLTGRDNGAYVNTAGWLSREGTLEVDAREPAFAALPDVNYEAPGFHEDGEPGILHPQFLHLLPELMAAASWVAGPSGLLGINAVLSGIALLAVFAFARRLLRPQLALAVVLSLALSLPQVHFARDAYSEILAQLFAFGGLWVLWKARDEFDAQLGFLAGLLLGATSMARIDGLVHLLPLSVYLTLEMHQAQKVDDHRARMRFICSVGFGLALTTLLAVADGWFYSRPYVESLSRFLWPVLLSVAGVVTVGVIISAIPISPRLSNAWDNRRKLVGAVAASTLGIGAGYAWFVRPLVDIGLGGSPLPLTETLQQGAGLPVEGTRTYAELSLQWLVWYLGPLAVAVGVAGCSLLWQRVITGKQFRSLPFLYVFTATTVLYLWRPNITPDHIWAIRRFLPVTIPGLLILSGWVAESLLRQSGPARFHIMRLAAVAVVLAMILFPVWTTAPLITTNSDTGMLEAVEDLCDHLGPDAVVLVVEEDGPLAANRLYPQTIRSFCGIPAAVVSEDGNQEDLGKLAGTLAAKGRNLRILSTEPRDDTSRMILSVTTSELLPTIDRRPDGILRVRYVLYETSPSQTS